MDFKISGMYSFEVYPVSVLGTAFKNVKILAIIDQETAEASGLDTKAMHALVYPSLPSSTPNDPNKYNYIKIKTPSGQTQLIGLAWIVANTVQVVNLGKFTIEVDNESSGSQSKLLDALAANGFKVSKISFDQATIAQVP
jgi:hypothetical protein